MLEGLTQLMFVQTLRHYIEALPDHERGWFSALRDPKVGRALVMMHECPAHDWTVAELAKRVGTSRSGFSARFTELLDISPINYLYRWRIRLATNLLEETSDAVPEIAKCVGYESESAFHRAFKREMGVSPTAFRNGRRRASPNL